MIYELRICDAAPGKLPALKDRCANHTVALLARHSISTVGFWISYVGSSTSTLSYILAWVDADERDRRWEAFTTDPEWITAQSLSEAGGPLVERVQSIMLSPTECSQRR